MEQDEQLPKDREAGPTPGTRGDGHGSSSPASRGRHDILESEHGGGFWNEVDGMLTGEFSTDLLPQHGDYTLGAIDSDFETSPVAPADLSPPTAPSSPEAAPATPPMPNGGPDLPRDPFSLDDVSWPAIEGEPASGHTASSAPSSASASSATPPPPPPPPPPPAEPTPAVGDDAWPTAPNTIVPSGPVSPPSGTPVPPAVAAAATTPVPPSPADPGSASPTVDPTGPVAFDADAYAPPIVDLDQSVARRRGAHDIDPGQPGFNVVGDDAGFGDFIPDLDETPFAAGNGTDDDESTRPAVSLLDDATPGRELPTVATESARLFDEVGTLPAVTTDGDGGRLFPQKGEHETLAAAPSASPPPPPPPTADSDQPSFGVPLIDLTNPVTLSTETGGPPPVSLERSTVVDPSQGAPPGSSFLEQGPGYYGDAGGAAGELQGATISLEAGAARPSGSTRALENAPNPHRREVLLDIVDRQWFTGALVSSAAILIGVIGWLVYFRTTGDDTETVSSTSLTTIDPSAASGAGDPDASTTTRSESDPATSATTAANTTDTAASSGPNNTTAATAAGTTEATTPSSETTPTSSGTTPTSSTTEETTSTSENTTSSTEETTPSSPTTEETTPSSPTTEETTPSSPTTEETTPSSPTSDDTTPSSPTTEETTPSSPTSDDTPPSSEDGTPPATRTGASRARMTTPSTPDEGSPSGQQPADSRAA